MDSKPTRILLIGKDEAIVSGVQGELSKMKVPLYQVTPVSRLEDALEKMSAEPFDAIMMDLNFPEKEPLVTLRRLQSRTPQIPIIVLADADQESLGREAVDAGADDYVFKTGGGFSFLNGSLRTSAKRKNIQTIKEEFFTALGHDVQTPIAIIREGVSQVLEGLCGDINAEQRRHLEMVLKNVDWLRGFIKDLLNRK